MKKNRSPVAALVATSMILPGLLKWPQIRAGTSAIVPLGGNLPVPMGAPVPLEFQAPEDWPFKFFPRALALALEAVQDLDFEPNRRYGLVLGLPNLFSESAYLEQALVERNNPKGMQDLLGFSHDFPLSWLARKLGIQGPTLRVDSACATGNDALIVAHQWLSLGLVDDVLVVAASAMLNPVGLALFNNLRALNDQADTQVSCPFDLRRRGFVMGEGAAAVWLSSNPPGKALGYLHGYGQSLNAQHFVDLPEDLEPMERACRMALAGLEEVAWVCAHGTSTVANDLAETKLLHRLFGKKAMQIPVSSVKSMIGHCLGAAALIEAIVCLHALKDGVAPPTLNLSQPDPLCDLDYIPQGPRAIHGNFVLSNAFAFGGQNSVILLSKELA